MSTLTIFTDGASRGNPGLAAVGVVIEQDQKIIEQLAVFLGTKTNNEAEYLAVAAALKWLKRVDLANLAVTKVAFQLDSQLVVEQLAGHWQIKEPRLQELAANIHHAQAAFKDLTFSFTHVPRAENKIADALANLALDIATKS